VIIIEGAKKGTRPVFCAGGDVVAVVKQHKDTDKQIEFFKTEYALNHLIGTSKKPIVALLDGVTSTFS
jgi:enoyl-CoA hydratase/carnithine racemase